MKRSTTLNLSRGDFGQSKCDRTHMHSTCTMCVCMMGDVQRVQYISVKQMHSFRSCYQYIYWLLCDIKWREKETKKKSLLVLYTSCYFRHCDLHLNRIKWKKNMRYTRFRLSKHHLVIHYDWFGLSRIDQRIRVVCFKVKFVHFNRFYFAFLISAHWLKKTQRNENKRTSKKNEHYRKIT